MKKESEINRYIENEKDISRCKISILESISNLSNSKRRSLWVEDSIVRFPFHLLNISSIASVDNALFLYKNNKYLFEKEYLNQIDTSKGLNALSYESSRIFFMLYKKILFLEKYESFFKKGAVEQINPVQNSLVFNDILLYTKKYSKKQLLGFDNEDILKLEPLIVSKKRARSQAIVMSAGIFISKSLDLIRADKAYVAAKRLVGDLAGYSEYSETLLFTDLIILNEKLDSIIHNIDNNLFKYYNDGLVHLFDVAKDTMGDNNYILKLKKLNNIILSKEMDNSNIFYKNLKITSPSIVFNKKDSSPIGHEYLVIMPLLRTGNERIFPFYHKIEVMGVDISTLLYGKFFNRRLLDSSGDKRYYKSMIFKDSCMKTLSSLPTSKFKVFYKSLLNMKNDTCIEHNLDNKHGNFIPIDMERSCIYTSKTRTDGEIMFSAMKFVSDILDNFKMDYFDICSDIDYSIKNRIGDRRAAISSYMDKK